MRHKGRTESDKSLRSEYQQEIIMLSVEDLLFVDEVGLNLGMARQFGWALSEQRAYGTRP
ncbi:hypothetical protein [Nostoc punctiforme]|uniref:hypothetical protein n=1 Tax=Nostoc punctiforme TaxID=272131 RepID=UPI0011D10764|nr:hypothetical protein [Nostoc punctiforme]